MIWDTDRYLILDGYNEWKLPETRHVYTQVDRWYEAKKAKDRERFRRRNGTKG